MGSFRHSLAETSASASSSNVPRRSVAVVPGPRCLKETLFHLARTKLLAYQGIEHQTLQFVFCTQAPGILPAMSRIGLGTTAPCMHHVPILGL